MKYQELGNSGIQVSKVALGTWGLGGGSVWTDKDSTVEEAKSILDACTDHGINYIDTAPVYGTGVSEQLLGEALKGRREKFILQSKCSLNWRCEGGNFHYERDGYTVNNDTTAAAVKKDVEESLVRMKTDYMDSVIVHYVCKSFPVEETVSALEDLIKEGKIRTYGLSNSHAADLDEYKNAKTRISDGVCVVQEFFSILSPFHGRKYFDTCRKYGTTFQVYGVLEEGFLTSPEFMNRTFAPSDIRSRIPWTGEFYKNGLKKAFEAWKPICEEHGCSYAALAEAWALSQYEKMSILVGMRKRENVADSAGCVNIELSEDEITSMENAVKEIQVEVLDK